MMLFNLKVMAGSVAVASMLLACAPASADTTMIIGGPGNSVNYIPFGSNGWLSEYQQVYAASDFTGPITIDDIVFYAGPGTTGTNSSKYTISLSTTSAAVNGLNTELSMNIGSDVTTVYNNATLPAIQDGVLTIALSTPFAYNPAAGNLLIDMKSQYAGTLGGGFEFDSASGGVFSRAYSGMTISPSNNSGLVTGFTVAAPEPSTWAMMILGFAGLGLAGYRAARKTRPVAA
jgi:hypothetical protein